MMHIIANAKSPKLGENLNLPLVCLNRLAKKVLTISNVQKKDNR